MNRLIAHTVIYSSVAGIFGVVFGGIRCVERYTYSVAPQHQATAVGRVVGIRRGKGGYSYHYVFSLNGVDRDDSSGVCATPLAPSA